MKNPVTIAAIAVVLGGLSACAIPHEELLRRDREECTQIGFQPGTDRHANCMLELHTERHRLPHRH